MHGDAVGFILSNWSIFLCTNCQFLVCFLGCVWVWDLGWGACAPLQCIPYFETKIYFIVAIELTIATSQFFFKKIAVAKDSLSFFASIISSMYQYHKA